MSLRLVPDPPYTVTPNGSVRLSDTLRAAVADHTEALMSEALADVTAELDEARQFARHYRDRAGANAERLPWEGM